MVRKKGSLILCGAFLFVAWNALLLLFLWGRPPIGRFGEGGGAEPGGREEWGAGRGGGVDLAGEVIRLAEEVESELETQKHLLKQIQSHRSLWERRKGKEVGKREMAAPKEKEEEEKKKEDGEAKVEGSPPPAPNQNQNQNQNGVENAGQVVKDSQAPPPVREAGPDAVADDPAAAAAESESKPATLAAPPQTVIPILVIACDRVTVKRSLDKLLQYRPSAELHPVIVSQDCGHADTAQVIASYGAQVTHLRQPDLSDIRVRPEHRKFQGYYKIARHYRWALNQVFNVLAYDTVVIVEDDLEVTPPPRPLRALALSARLRPLGRGE